MAMELVDNLPWMAGAERWGGVAPVLDDVLREVGRLTDGALPRVQHGPLGISRETIANLEKDPRNGLSDLQGALRFADARHPSRRRQIASDAVARTVRDMSNLEGIVDDVFQHRLSDVSWALRGSLGKAPELHAVLRGRLARDAFLEELIDKSLGSSHVSEYGALLSALSLADLRIHANAIEILSTPERASALARRALTVGPANWIGLLRQPEVARAVLGHVEEKRWAEYWSCLPLAFPDWSRALQFQLRRYGSALLGRHRRNTSCSGRVRINGPARMCHFAIYQTLFTAVGRWVTGWPCGSWIESGSTPWLTSATASQTFGRLSTFYGRSTTSNRE
jgi:hypothetical protein